MRRADFSRLALAAVLLLAAASVFSGCRKASAGIPHPSVPDPDGKARPFLLTGELAAVRSADLFVPETPLWALQLRYLAEDGTAVRQGERSRPVFIRVHTESGNTVMTRTWLPCSRWRRPLR